jgi:hypothetical protein
MEPIIEDCRTRTPAVPAIEVLQRIVPLIPADYLRGIRKIVLLDRDYRGMKAGGRYVAVRGTWSADVELFLDSYSSLPETLRTSRLYVTFYLGWGLLHEIYHHRVRRAKGRRKPTDRLEDERADRWAHQQAHRILESLFPRAQHHEEYELIRRARQEMQPATRPQP